MQMQLAGNDPTPSMAAFQARLKPAIERYVAVAFVLMLLGALWTTALARISDRAPATELLTSAGTDLINPLLLAHGSGIAQSTYQQLEQAAAAHPNQPVSIPFLKVQILGKAIAGKSFAAGSQIICAQVADAYYTGGPGAAFTLPPELQTLVGTYTPFVAPSSATGAGSGIPSPLPAFPLPQLPSWLTQPMSVVGFTPLTLTASAHNDAVSHSRWFWGISIALALVLVLLNTGWTRLWSVAWPVFHASWHIALIGAVASFIVSRNPVQAAPYRGVLDSIGGTFLPVFYVAALLGVAGIVVSLIGRRLTNPAATPAPEPAMALAARAQLNESLAAGGSPPTVVAPEAAPPTTENTAP